MDAFAQFFSRLWIRYQRWEQEPLCRRCGGPLDVLARYIGDPACRRCVHAALSMPNWPRA